MTTMEAHKMGAGNGRFILEIGERIDSNWNFEIFEPK